MSQHGKLFAILVLSIATIVSGLAVARQVIAVTGEVDAERLNRAILDFVATKNPQAPIRAFQGFPETLVDNLSPLWSDTGISVPPIVPTGFGTV